MIIQLQPEQVSEYWFSIKYAACAAMETDSPEYVQSLLRALLSETHQCWLIMDEGELVAMGITCIVEEALTGKRQLHIDAFYSYTTLSDELAHQATDYVSEYAAANNCSVIRSLTNNPRASRLLVAMGFYNGKQEWLLNI